MLPSTRTIGQLAQLACEWEVLARKAGNVCPGREFPDLTVYDFLKSAAAIAPVMDEAPHQPLGVTILRAIEATRKVVKTNTNLGIVLLLAPLASVPLEESLQTGIKRVLANTTVEDSHNVYRAIRLAKPSGLGKVDAQDIASEPTLPLRDVMALAMDRDLIAAQYATDFDITRLVHELLTRSFPEQGNVERAIIETQLYMLFRNGDDLVRRKFGNDGGIWRLTVINILNQLNHREGRQAFLEFDAFLRSDNHARNPGTTADLIAAGLFVALREKQIAPDAPFTWNEHPFAIGA
jgi:triphosphoribosyl-dephospho-CoA synthase